MENNHRPKCDKCDGQVIREGDELKCLQCGKAWLSNKEKSDFYELNKAEIMEDIHTVGRTRACQKWQTPRGSIGKLVIGWTAAEPIPLNIARDPAIAGKLPAFPEFNNDWPEPVQLHWIDAYLTLIGIKPKEEVKHE